MARDIPLTINLSDGEVNVITGAAHLQACPRAEWMRRAMGAYMTQQRDELAAAAPNNKTTFDKKVVDHVINTLLGNEGV